MENSANYNTYTNNINMTYINILLDLIFKECPDGIVFKDKNLKYMAANKAFYKLCKIENQNNLLGNDCIQNISKENQKLIADVNQSILENQQAVSYVINLGNDSSEKIVSITSTPIVYESKFLGIISIVKDITQEENVKERFVLKHFQLKSLLENIPMIIYMQDKNLHYVAGTNRAKEFVKNGYDAFNNISFKHDNIKNLNSKESFNSLKNNETTIKEIKVVDNKELPHYYKIYKVPITNYNNDVTGVVTLADNIDAEKQLQAQRETFVASIGHDLKNPTIAQIRGLELLLRGNFGELKSEQKELVEMILDSCRYMKGMLSSLLETYRNYKGNITLNFEEFSFPDLVMECVSEMIYVAKDKNVGISISNNFTTDLIVADRVQIKRVLMNLLSNGIKYAFKETLLNINVDRVKDYVCFEFENQSPYIPKEKQEAIFAQYVSYASAHKELGIGLGLYASKKIIDAHCGNIYVKSYKENRNIFGFVIPISNNFIKNSKKEICF